MEMSHTSWTGKRVLVTGGTGFIGSSLVRVLVERGASVRVLTRNPDARHPSTGDTLVGDLFSLSPAKLHGIDTVFHCAGKIAFGARDYQETEMVNVQGTRALLEASHGAGVRKVVHLSACAVLGFSRAPALVDESASPVLTPENAYAYTKSKAEDIVRSCCQRGLDCSIANISTVYGAGDVTYNSGSVIRLVYRRALRIIPPGGTSYVSLEDLIEGLLLLADKGRLGQRYIFSSENLRYRNLIDRIASVVGVTYPRPALPRISYLPLLMAVHLLERLRRSSSTTNLMTPQIVKEMFGFKYFDNSKARGELGWEPRQSLENAVARAVEFYSSRGWH